MGITTANHFSPERERERERRATNLEMLTARCSAKKHKTLTETDATTTTTTTTCDDLDNGGTGWMTVSSYLVSGSAVSSQHRAHREGKTYSGRCWQSENASCHQLAPDARLRSKNYTGNALGTICYTHLQDVTFTALTNMYMYYRTIFILFKSSTT